MKPLKYIDDDYLVLKPNPDRSEWFTVEDRDQKRWDAWLPYFEESVRRFHTVQKLDLTLQPFYPVAHATILRPPAQIFSPLISEAGQDRDPDLLVVIFRQLLVVSRLFLRAKTVGPTYRRINLALTAGQLKLIEWTQDPTPIPKKLLGFLSEYPQEFHSPFIASCLAALREFEANTDGYAPEGKRYDADASLEKRNEAILVLLERLLEMFENPARPITPVVPPPPPPPPVPTPLPAPKMDPVLAIVTISKVYERKNLLFFSILGMDGHDYLAIRPTATLDGGRRFGALKALFERASSCMPKRGPRWAEHPAALVVQMPKQSLKNLDSIVDSLAVVQALVEVIYRLSSAGFGIAEWSLEDFYLEKEGKTLIVRYLGLGGIHLGSGHAPKGIFEDEGDITEIRELDPQAAAVYGFGLLLRKFLAERLPPRRPIADHHREAIRLSEYVDYSALDLRLRLAVAWCLCRTELRASIQDLKKLLHDEVPVDWKPTFIEEYERIVGAWPNWYPRSIYAEPTVPPTRRLACDLRVGDILGGYNIVRVGEKIGAWRCFQAFHPSLRADVILYVFEAASRMDPEVAIGKVLLLNQFPKLTLLQKIRFGFNDPVVGFVLVAEDVRGATLSSSRQEAAEFFRNQDKQKTIQVFAQAFQDLSVIHSQHVGGLNFHPDRLVWCEQGLVTTGLLELSLGECAVDEIDSRDPKETYSAHDPQPRDVYRLTCLMVEHLSAQYDFTPLSLSAPLRLPQKGFPGLLATIVAAATHPEPKSRATATMVAAALEEILLSLNNEILEQPVSTGSPPPIVPEPPPPAEPPISIPPISIPTPSPKPSPRKTTIPVEVHRDRSGDGLRLIPFVLLGSAAFIVWFIV